MQSLPPTFAYSGCAEDLSTETAWSIQSQECIVYSSEASPRFCQKTVPEPDMIITGFSLLVAFSVLFKTKRLVSAVELGSSKP